MAHLSTPGFSKDENRFSKDENPVLPGDRAQENRGKELEHEIVEAGAERLGAGRESSRSNRLPHDSNSLNTKSLVHPFARSEISPMQPESAGRNLPVVTIFAESGPLAGDLAACLSGRFSIDRVTSLQGALKSVVAGCQALLILRGTEENCGPACTDLIKQALDDNCRVLILGSGGLGLESDLDSRVVHLPPLPSPQILFENLADLEARAKG